MFCVYCVQVKENQEKDKNRIKTGQKREAIFTFDDIERNEGEKGLVEGDGPTVVTGGPVASMATLPFVPKVQMGLLVEARFINLNLESDLIKSPIIVGSPINFKWQNKDNIVVAKNAQRKYYEGPTTTSLDVLNSLSLKIATTKCVGAELFERFKLIAKSDRSNAPYDPGGTGLIPSETTREVKLFRRVYPFYPLVYEFVSNALIITITATSCFHHHTNHNKIQSQPLDHLPAVTVPPMIVYEDVNTLSKVSTVLYEVENPIIDDEPVVVDDKEVLVVNEAKDIHEVTRSTWQSPMEKVQMEFVFPVKEKPLAGSRFAGQRKLTTKVNPEGVGQVHMLLVTIRRQVPQSNMFTACGICCVR
nr:hypothetical protein CTI12_AA402100 [Tanacetum cinerariifolium]